MKELLTYIAKNLVNDPDAVNVTETMQGEEIVFELRVAPDDMGKVIGRHCRNFRLNLFKSRGAALFFYSFHLGGFSMKKQYLEIGKIVNTHGIRGDIKVQPWCDSPDFLAEFDTLYRKDQSPITITSAKVHKGCVLMHLEGVDTVEQAQAMRGMTLYMNRDDVELEEGAFFIQDVIGLPVYDERVGREIGVVKEISDGPAGDLYVIQDGKTQHMIPGVPEFLKEVDLENGRVTVHTIEGLLSDEI